MNTQIDYISIEDFFWIQFREELVSFGHHYLPADVHFTISYNSRSEDINFHLTRNVFDCLNKPKITIACMNKELFKDLQEPLSAAIFNKLFVPLDIRFWRGKYGRDLCYLSFSELEKDKRKEQVEEKITQSFKEISHVKRKSKLKIKGATEKKITGIIASAKMRNLMLDNLRSVPVKFIHHSDAGFLLTKKQVVPFIRFGDNWYRIKDQVKPMDLLMAGVDTVTSKELVNKFNESLTIIKTAKSYHDTEPYDNPICLVRHEP
jgi:hypothetical protein